MTIDTYDRLAHSEDPRRAFQAPQRAPRASRAPAWLEFGSSPLKRYALQTSAFFSAAYNYFLSFLSFAALSHDMGCGASSAKSKASINVVKVESQTDGKIEDEDILTLLRSRSCRPVINDARPKEILKAALDLLDLKDEQVMGKWSKLSWGDLQESAVTSILVPSTIHQGDTTTCGAISVLEAMAYFRPKRYAKLYAPTAEASERQTALR